jgi:hypothetical protein
MQLYKNCFNLFTLNTVVVKKRHSNIASPIIFLLLFGLSNVLFAQTPPFPAPNISASLAGSEWTISWWVSGTVDHYDLYSSNSRGAGLAARLPATTRFYKTTIASEYLDFVVQACNANNQCSTSSAKVRIEPPLPKFPAPTIIATLLGTEWRIDWSYVSSAVDHYDLYSSNSRGRGRIASFPVAPRQYKTTIASEYLDFEVVACYASNQCGAFSKSVRIRPPLPKLAAPVISTTLSGLDWIISWTKPAGEVDHYLLSESTCCAGAGRIIPAGTLQYTSTFARDYLNYAVQACDINNICGDISERVRVDAPPAFAAPVITQARTGSIYTVYWSVPAGPVSYYELEENTKGGIYIEKLSSATTSYKPTSQYTTYRVRACDVNANCGAYSAGFNQQLAVILSPPAISKVLWKGEWIITWASPAEEISGIGYYHLLEISAAEVKQHIHPANSISYFTKASTTEFSYSVQACYSDGVCGDYSDTVKFAPLPFDAPIITYAKTGSVYTVYWSVPAGPVSYFELEGNTKGGIYVEKLSTDITSLKPTTPYTQYRIRACDVSANCGTYSEGFNQRHAAILTPPEISKTLSGKEWTISWVSPSYQIPEIAYYSLLEISEIEVRSLTLNPSTTFYKTTPNAVITYSVKACYSDDVCTSYSKTVRIDPSAVVVSDSEAAIRAVWGDVAKSLIAGDKNILAQQFDPAVLDQYSQVFDLLGPQIADVGKQLGNIEPLYVNETTAVYLVTKKGEDGGDYAHTIKFIKDANGAWKVNEL